MTNLDTHPHLVILVIRIERFAPFLVLSCERVAHILTELTCYHHIHITQQRITQDVTTKIFLYETRPYCIMHEAGDCAGVVFRLTLGLGTQL